MNDISYTVLKLANGEEIICEVDFEQYDDSKDLLKRVYEIQFHQSRQVERWFIGKRFKQNFRDSDEFSVKIHFFAKPIKLIVDQGK